MKWPWALTDCALNLTVRQRKNVLPSVYRSVKPHHLQLNYSQFMKKREESSCSLKDSLLQQKMLCILPNVQLLHVASQARTSLNRRKRHVEASLLLKKANLSEVLLTRAASSV